MRLDEYVRFDALGLADLVRRGEVTPAELANLAAEAIRSVDPALNFMVGETADPDQAASRPIALDAPFAGAPFLIKDVGAAVGGQLQEQGSGLAQGLVADRDSELARRFRAAGLVFLGRTTTPELGATFTTESRATGATRNPWDLSRSTGGSSGGAAAAVASGAFAIAHAGDSAGSIRIPAHCCGLFGFKPTRGRNPVGPQSGEVNCGLTTAHILSRTVRDSAAMLDATAGADPGCRYGAPSPGRAFLAAAGQPPRRLRIAVSVHSPLAGSVSDEVVQATNDTARLCEQLGHIVEAAEPSFDPDRFVATLETIWSANTFHGVRKLAELTGRTPGPGNLERSTLAMVERGAAISADELLGALDDMNRFSREFAAFFETYDVFVSPTFAEPAPLLGVIRSDAETPDTRAYIRDLFRMAAFTAQYNMSGQPAMSVPLHIGASGLPIGTHFAARFGDDETLFALAGQLEAAAPWIHRHAPSSLRAAPMEGLL